MRQKSGLIETHQLSFPGNILSAAIDIKLSSSTIRIVPETGDDTWHGIFSQYRRDEMPEKIYIRQTVLRKYILHFV